jgi:hypothetical protein
MPHITAFYSITILMGAALQMYRIALKKKGGGGQIVAGNRIKSKYLSSLFIQRHFTHYMKSNVRRFASGYFRSQGLSGGTPYMLKIKIVQPGVFRTANSVNTGGVSFNHTNSTCLLLNLSTHTTSYILWQGKYLPR